MGTLPNEAPLFTFGVIADVQYADRDDALNFPRTVVRHYRNARTLTRRAYEHWSSLPARDSCTWNSSSNWPRPDFVLQLGDLIDGWNSRQSGPKSRQPNSSRSHESATVSERAVSALAPYFSALPAPTFHVWGNHELYCFTRSQLLSHPVLGSSVRALGFPSIQNTSEYSALQRLGFCSSTTATTSPSVPSESESESQSQSQLPVADAERSTPNVFPGYYSFTYPPSVDQSAGGSGSGRAADARSRWRFVALDTYEVTALGYAPHEAPFVEAQRTLALRNPNEDKNSPTGANSAPATHSFNSFN